MWILKNSNELLEQLKTPNFNIVTSIKSFDFSTLYITISDLHLKSRLATIIRNYSQKKSQIQVFGFTCRSRQGTFWFEKQVHWRWHNQHAKVSSRHFRGLREERFSNRKSAFLWAPIMTLSLPTYFCTHTKRNSYSLCSRLKRNS